MRQDLSRGVIMGLLLVAIAFSIALFSPTLLRYGHDIFYHLTRTEALYDQLMRGVWASPINYFFFGGAGYASSACYPDLFLYIPAFFRLLGLNPGQACSAFIVCCSVASCVTAYWSALQLTHRRWSAAVAAIVYTLCQYRLDCMYTRGALGEIQAFIFIPLAMYAVYDLIFLQFRRPYIMVVAFAGLMLTHTISLFMAVLLACIACLVFWQRVWRRLPQVIALGLLTLGLTAFFWLPCVEMLLTMPLKASQPWTTAVENAVDPALLFSNIVLQGNKASMGLGLFVMCLSILILLRRQLPAHITGIAVERWEATRKQSLFFLFTGLLIAFAATSFFPWKYAGFIGVIQFPWRLYSFASWFIAIGSAGALSCVAMLISSDRGQEQKKYTILVLAVLFCMAITAWQHYSLLPSRYYTVGHDYFSNPAESVYIGKEEWMPLGVDRDVLRADNRHCVDDAARVLPYSVSSDRRILTVTINDDERRWIDVPFIWYRGYIAVFVNDKDGTKTPLTVTGAGRNGFCRVSFPLQQGQIHALGTGQVRVWYAGTMGQSLALWISLLSFLFTLGLSWHRHRKNDAYKQ